MLFRRRHKPDLAKRLQVMVWPRGGWRRASAYMMKRVLRLSGTPHAIALGCAAGVFASFTPFVGFHFLIGIAVAWLTGGNVLASAFGTFIGNPITFPLIWAGTYRIGNWILGQHQAVSQQIDISAGIFSHSLERILPLVKPMAVGSLPIGLIAALLSYFPVRAMIRAYQSRRRERLRARTRMRAQDGDA